MDSKSIYKIGRKQSVRIDLSLSLSLSLSYIPSTQPIYTVPSSYADQESATLHLQSRPRLNDVLIW